MVYTELKISMETKKKLMKIYINSLCLYKLLVKNSDQNYQKKEKPKKKESKKKEKL